MTDKQAKANLTPTPPSDRGLGMGGTRTLVPHASADVDRDRPTLVPRRASGHSFPSVIS